MAEDKDSHKDRDKHLRDKDQYQEREYHRFLDQQELEDLRDLRLHPGYNVYLALLHELADDWRDRAMAAKDWESFVAARQVYEVINYSIIPLIFGELEELEVPQKYLRNID